MNIKVGSARINEFGEISGGVSGDQTGKECMIEDCYIHPQGWVIIRAKEKEHRKPDHLKKVTKKDINTAQIMV